jgi:hypothetical protein
VTDRLIRITTALAVATVAAVAAVAAIISYRQAYELVSTHGETGLTARLVPFTVRRPDPRGQHAHPRRQPAEPAGTTPGALVPRRRHRRHHRRQPGARHRPRPHRRASQRVARPRASWLVRTPNDPDQGPDDRNPLRHRSHHTSASPHQPLAPTRHQP